MAVGLLASGLGAATAAPEAADRATTTTAGTRTVTLVTGDRVLLNGDRLGSVTGGPGREGAAFHAFHRAGRLHVVPRDAVRPLAEGKLDLRLFDVTGLVEAGYDDARRTDVPLIVTGSGARTAAGASVTADLPVVGAVAVRAEKVGAAGLFDSLVTDPDVTKVWLDGVRLPSLDRSTAQIGAPAAWTAGYTGQGVKVAVLDGGVDGAHPDLAGQEVAERNFTEDPDATDLDGHGTHVAATIASRHAKYRGVAPDAKLLDGKVCSRGGCRESWILDGLQWAADQGADVVNLSLGGTDTPEVDPVEEAVNRLSAKTGALFVVAAGNSGSRPGTVSSPSTADAALAVGAVGRDERIAPFSSRGPRAGDGGVKPDVTAPGVDIAAAKASKGNIGTPVDETHVALSGTSMASPHVAGAAALLAQQHPDWTGAQLKAALVASAKPNPDLGPLDQGTGRVDLAKAITTTLTSDPVSVALGHQPWPHDDDVPVTKQLTYRNTGPTPVTLDLTVDARGPDGKPAPAGVFTVAPTTVTVPAGGAARVAVTGDAKAAATDGAHVGAVVTSTGLRTPISLDREVESYDVGFKYTDADGKPADRASSLVIGLTNDAVVFPVSSAGTAEARLPKGDYLALNDVLTGDRIAQLPQPLLRVAGEVTVDADARLAKPVAVTFPDPDAEDLFGGIGLTRTVGDRTVSATTVFLGGFRGAVSLAQLGPALPADELTTTVSANAKGAPVGTTPVNYRAAWSERGKVPTGFTRAPARDELAKVTTAIGPRPTGRSYRYGGLPVPPDGGSSSGVLSATGPDGDAVDYVLAKGMNWVWLVLQVDERNTTEVLLRSPERGYRAGGEYRQRFGRPVFGPILPDSPFPYSSRLGDAISFALPLWGDGYGNIGDSNTTSARTTLYRDGKKVGEYPNAANGRFEVAPGAGEFKVDTEGVRVPGASEFSTKVAGTWTFRSDTVPGTTPRALPLTVVRFEPELDDQGAAPADRVLRVPLKVQQHKGGADGKVRRLDVEVSFDDGRTWSKAPVTGRTALVRNGAAGGFASLRVKGADSAGNTFEHTLIRAYRIK
ncbi:S8 family serine peptidase [Saccharothrix australiensis]|uniref:S8 family serine peptidase n=1 Tax=Saccharothrix australiensis TaxID=2072 RepID=UPI001FE36383|nr:S8 family serine peptidase [Saccharothrix australiensis]